MDASWVGSSDSVGKILALLLSVGRLTKTWKASEANCIR